MALLIITPAGGGTPGGSDTQIQFNDSGIFGGSSYAVFNKTTGLVTLSPPSLTVATPSSLTVTIEEDPSYGWLHGTDTWNAKVYAYKVDPSTSVKIFSSSFATTTDQTASGRENYRVNLSWSTVSGADGYRVLISSDILGYTYDHYIDKATNGYIDNNDQIYLSDPIVIPSSPQNAHALKTVAGHIYVDGNIKATGTLEVLGGVAAGVDSYGMYYHETLTDSTRVNTIGSYVDINFNPSSLYAGNVYGNYTKLTIPNTASTSMALYGSFVDINVQQGVTSLVGQFVSVLHSATGTATQVFGAQYSVSKGGTATLNNFAGLRLTAGISQTGNITIVRGADIQLSLAPTGSTFTTVEGGYFLISSSAGGTYTNASAGHFDVNVTAATAITALYGIKLDWALSGVTPTNAYGLYLPSISGATTNYAVYTNTGKIRLGDKVTTYNAINTTGWGIPSIYGTGRSTAQTAAVTSVATYTVGASDGSFVVSANVLVTTATLHNFTVTVAYTDEGNTARTLTLTFASLAGTLVTAIANAAGAVPYEGVPLHIRCKASTTITIATTGTFTTCTYNVEGSIIQIA